MESVWQNRQTKGGALRIGPLVKSLIKAQGLDRPNSLGELNGIWGELVGEQFSRHTRLEAFRNSTLRVVVNSAAHMAELKMMVADGLAEQISAQLGEQSVKAIRLRLGH